ncbi:MAG TPA: MMPL family transporter, partial [Candidatus Polarisedimenticolia bacterium]|nr:MMPL family transporter [Candidatus Polarisedimenticolia bacterium]
EKVRQGEWRPEELGRRLASHPLFGSLIVSEDGESAAVLIDVERSGGRADYRAGLVRQVRALAARLGRGMEVHVAGIPVEKVDVAEYVRRDQRIFIPLVFGLLALFTLFLYRHPSGMLIPIGVVTLSLLWTLGLYGAAGRSLNPVTALITPVILVVSVAESIHLLNHHLAGRAEGLVRRQALEQAFRHSRVPSFNASFTTAIGFGTLVTLPYPAIRDFGLFTAAGVMISYLLTMTLAPLLIDLLPDFPPRVTTTFRPGPIEGFLRKITRATSRHLALATVSSVAILGLALLGIFRIRTETDLLHSLRPDSPLSRATEFIDHHLTGVNSLEILVRGASWEDPNALAVLARFEDSVRAMPGVRKVTGYPDLIARVNRALHQGDDAFGRLPEGPDSRSELEEIRELLKEQAGGEMARFVSADGRTLRVATRVTALNTSASQKLLARIRGAAAESGLGSLSLTGNFAVLSDMSTTLVRNQLRGLVPALAVILTAMAVQFRSLRLALIGAIPTGAPVLMTYGLMGWIGIPLSVPTAMIASIALGMTDDNTIHLLDRFRGEFRKDGDYEIALEAMMDSSGRAVLFSTVTVAAGFCVGAFSSFRPSVHFAVLTGLTLVLGLLCELILLPLTLVLFQPLGAPSRRGSVVGSRAALTLLVAILLLLGSPASGTASPAESLLRDQYGREDSPARHTGKPLLLLYGKPPDLRRMKSWEVKIKEKAGSDFAVLRAVDARGIKGKKTEVEVNERLRKGVPERISVLVDWEGALVRAYALPETGAVATLLDPKGRPCGTWSGPARDESVSKLVELIARVREKGTCP